MPAGASDWVEGFATGILPWDMTPDLGGPRRGSLADYGLAVVEDEDPAPDKLSMIYADLINGLQRHAEAMDRAVISVGFSVTLDGGGIPVLSQVTGPPTVATDVGNFTFLVNGTGDVTISWPANTFPASVLGPLASPNDGTVGGGATAALVSNGVRVKTWTGASTAAHRAFTVTVR